jgi:CheY-like chemotaxis protein
MVACGILQQAGHTVEVANNGAEVLPLLAVHSIDVVLMDIQMPQMDGFQATAAIRELEKQTGAHLPVIAMTAHAMAGYKEKCLAAGMDGYVTKPVRQDLLLAALAPYQTVAPQPDGARGAASLPAHSDPTPAKAKPSAKSLFDIGDLVERLMGNEKLAKAVVGAFVDGMPEQLAALAKAIADSDAPATRYAAHSIKGAAANVSCGALRELASTLEKLAESGAMERAPELLLEFSPAFEAVKPAIQRFRSGDA